MNLAIREVSPAFLGSMPVYWGYIDPLNGRALMIHISIMVLRYIAGHNHSMPCKRGAKYCNWSYDLSEASVIISTMNWYGRTFPFKYNAALQLINAGLFCSLQQTIQKRCYMGINHIFCWFITIFCYLSNWTYIEIHYFTQVNNVRIKAICRIKTACSMFLLGIHLQKITYETVVVNILERLQCFLWRFLAATNEWFSPSVRLSVCLSATSFHYVPIIVSWWKVQELSPMTKVTSMQKVRGQRSRSQRSKPNLTISGL